MTALDASIATIESVCAIVEAQNGARNTRRHDMRVSEEEFAEMQAKRSRWTRGGNINGDRPAAGVADNTAGFYPADAGSTPARPAQSTSGVVPRGGGRSTTMDACTAGRSGPLTSLPRAYERDILAACLQALELPAPVREYRFHETRLWRFDYAWPSHLLALEVEGGIWTQGRHTRGAGALADIEKYSAAAIAGWRIIYCTPDDLQTAGLDRVRRALNRPRRAV